MTIEAEASAFFLKTSLRSTTLLKWMPARGGRDHAIQPWMAMPLERKTTAASLPGSPGPDICGPWAERFTTFSGMLRPLHSTAAARSTLARTERRSSTLFLLIDMAPVRPKYSADAKIWWSRRGWRTIGSRGSRQLLTNCPITKVRARGQTLPRHTNRLLWVEHGHGRFGWKPDGRDRLGVNRKREGICVLCEKLRSALTVARSCAGGPSVSGFRRDDVSVKALGPLQKAGSLIRSRAETRLTQPDSSPEAGLTRRLC